MKTYVIFCSLFMTITLKAAVSVGPISDVDCQFNDLQSALDGADPVIRLSNQTVIMANAVSNGQNHQIIGGYNNCADANSGLPASAVPTELTALDPTQSVITINGMNVTSDVLLQGLNISGTTAAAGLMISEIFGTIHLIDADINNNANDNGGGVFITGENGHLIVVNSIIQGNQADTNGGGIYCLNSQVTLDASTLVQENKALGTIINRGRGGGLFADNCEVMVFSGHKDGASAGFIANQSNREGAGIAVSDSILWVNGQQESPAVYGDNSQPALFKDNLSDSNNSNNGGGAAIYVRRSQAQIQAAWFDGNKASENGVGSFNRGSVIYAERGAQVTMSADTSQPCWREGLCNLVTNNNHVLIYAQRPETVMTIHDTEFFNNTTDFTGMIWVRNSCCLDEGDGPDLFFENNLVHHNTSANAGLIKTDVSNELCCEVSINFNGNTVVDNDFSDEVLDINLNAKLQMHHNIIKEDNGVVVMDVLDDPSTETNISCLVAHSSEQLPAEAVNVQIAEPQFVDADSFDYHLQASSPAIDACDDTLFMPSRLDMDQQSKGHDISDINNINGPYDAGVDEYYLPDVIFRSDFE